MSEVKSFFRFIVEHVLWEVGKIFFVTDIEKLRLEINLLAILACLLMLLLYLLRVLLLLILAILVILLSTLVIGALKAVHVLILLVGLGLEMVIILIDGFLLK